MTKKQVEKLKTILTKVESLEIEMMPTNTFVSDQLAEAKRELARALPAI